MSRAIETPPINGLHVLVDSTVNPATIDEIINSKPMVIQLRDKTMTTDEMVIWGKAVKERVTDSGILLIVNDRLTVAQQIDADGLHVGQDDLPASEARAALPQEKILGVSAATVEEAQKAENDGANYLGVGPIFQTSSKPDAAAPIGLPNLREIRQASQQPLVAIGGIDQQNAKNVIQTGANGIAVISAVLQAEKPGEATRQLNRIIFTARRKAA